MKFIVDDFLGFSTSTTKLEAFESFDDVDEGNCVKLFGKIVSKGGSGGKF